jgi:hypothetical protein
MKTKILFMAMVALAVPAGSAAADDIRLEDCPAAVQQAVLANSRDGRVDDIELLPDGRTYEVEVNLPRLRERQLRIAADGAVLETVEDIDLAEAPEPVRRTVESETTAGARLEEVERKTASGTTVFLAEIDLPDDRDLYLEVSDNGSILNRLVRD